MKRFTIAALAALVVALGGCSNNDLNSPNGNINGRFSLRTINGQNLPYTLQNGATIISDVATLSSDGSYTDDAQLGDGSVGTEEGYYINNNGSIQFNDNADDLHYSGSLTGSVLTEIVNGDTYVYQSF